MACQPESGWDGACVLRDGSMLQSDTLSLGQRVSIWPSMLISRGLTECGRNEPPPPGKDPAHEG